MSELIEEVKNSLNFENLTNEQIKKLIEFAQKYQKELEYQCALTKKLKGKTHKRWVELTNFLHEILD